MRLFEVTPGEINPAAVGTHRFRLGEWVVEVDRNRLIRGNEVVRIEPKAAEVLAALHARRGETVRKEDLIAAVWGDVAVSDDVLTTAIYQLRRTLGDNRLAPRYIETVPRRGYRLIAQDVPPSDKPITAKRNRVLLAVVVPTVIAAVLSLLFIDQRRDRAMAAELHRLASTNVRRGVELESAARMLHRAAELDPRNDAVLGFLALTLALDETASSEEARRTADRALQLDGGNSDAHVARGLIALWDDWNWEGARRGFTRAAEQGDAVARAWLGYLSALTGDEAAARAAVEGVTSPPLAATTASTALLLLGDFDGAERLVSAGLRDDRSNSTLIRQLRKVRDRRLQASRPSGSADVDEKTESPTDIARLHLSRGDTEAALAALERAYRERDDRLLYLRVDDRWEPLRRHPRFASLTAAVGLKYPLP